MGTAADASDRILNGMTLAYLTNQYPKVSHVFIRREICALEKRGWDITRISIRRAHELLRDPADLYEAKRTHVLLDGGIRALSRAWFEVQRTRPARFQKALQLALKMGWRSARGIARHFAYLAEACVLLQECAVRDIQHIHVHHATNPAAVALLCNLLGGPSYSLSVHGPEEFEQAPRLALREKIARAAFVVSPSEYGCAELSRWCADSDRAKIHLVRCGIDDQFLDEPPTPVPDVARFVCVGRLAPQKDPMTLVQAIRILFNSGTRCELVWLGDGPMRAELEKEIQRNHSDLPIRLMGVASSREVLEQLRMARALVLPSVAENIPSVIMEAFALRRPVISTIVGGIGELVQNDVNGWLIPPRSPAALAAALCQALQTPTTRLDEMAYHGAERVKRFHNVAVQAEQLEELFRSIGCHV